MDKQIVDIDGRKVVRVNDLRLDEVEGSLRLVAVDVGRGRPAPPAGHRGSVPDGRAQPAAAASPSATSTGRTSTRSRRSIASIKPARPARAAWPSSTRPTSPTIIDQLTPRDRAGVLASLDDEAARRRRSRRWSPTRRSRCSRTSSPERAADILEEMSPDDAADLVADLSDRAATRSSR